MGNWQTCGFVPGGAWRRPQALSQLEALTRVMDNLYVKTSYSAGRWFWSVTSYADNSEEVRRWALRAVGLGQAADAVARGSASQVEPSPREGN